MEDDTTSEDPLALDIGHVALAFAILEGSLANLLLMVLRAEEAVGRALTAGKTFSQMVELTQELIDHRASGASSAPLPQEVADDFRVWASTAITLSRDRNAAIHQVWFAGPDGWSSTDRHCCVKGDVGDEQGCRDASSSAFSSVHVGAFGVRWVPVPS